MISILVASEMWKVEVRLIKLDFSPNPFRFSGSIDDGLVVSSGPPTAGDMMKTESVVFAAWHLSIC